MATTSTNSPVYAFVSEPAYLKCRIDISRPFKYSWTKLNGGTANTFTTAYQIELIHTHTSFYRVTSTLTIAKVELEHYGTYNCALLFQKYNRVTLIVNCEYLS